MGAPLELILQRPQSSWASPSRTPQQRSVAPPALLSGPRPRPVARDTRKGIQAAMKSHIDENTVNGRYIIYDAVTGELKKLKFDRVHKGIVKKADFYVSCADFIDEGGKKYDLDLLVVKKDGDFRAVDTIVHSIDGKKRKYHLED